MEFFLCLAWLPRRGDAGGTQPSHSMKRFFRKFARVLLPGFARAALKASVTRRYYRPPPLSAGNGLGEDHGTTLTAVFDHVRLVVPGAARADVAAIVNDRFAAQELAAIRAGAGPGGRLLDVGAHRGLVGAFYCAGDPAARAWCFEPSLPLAEACRMLAGLNGLAGRMQGCETALGATPHRQNMRFDPVGGFVPIQSYAPTMWGESQKVEFQVDTVDAFCAREQVVPTLIKIDVEGFEGEVLRGATETLRRLRLALLVELHLSFLADRGLSPDDVLQPLVAQGYRYFLLDGRPVDMRALCDCPLNRLHFLARPAP